MIDVTIKTLDSRTRSFSVPEQITVKEFKDRIASSVEISAETQRLIFRGRVLQDDKKLNDYNVHGQTIHLVEKPPPSSRPPPSPQPPAGSQPGEAGGQNGNSFFVGAITLPAEVTEARDVQRIVQQVVSDMGEVGRNARVTSRASPDGSSVDVHINLGSINIPQVSESQQRANHIRQLLRQANLILDRLETPPHLYHQLPPHPNQAGTQTEPPAEDMDTSPDAASTGAASGEQSAHPGAPGGDTPAASTGTSTTSSGSNGGRGQRRNGNGPTHPRSVVMADILRDVNQLNSRLQPHLDNYQEVLRTDPAYPAEEFGNRQEAQRLQNLTSQVLHIISHIYHSVSDCTVDLRSAPPRNLNATPIVPTMGTPGFGPIPMQVNIGPAPGANRNTPPAANRNTPPATNRNAPPATSAQQTTSTSQSTTSTPSTSASTAGTASTTSSPNTGSGQVPSTPGQPTIQVTNSTRTFVIRPNTPGGGTQSQPAGGTRSFTIRGPTGMTIRAPGGATIRTGMPPNHAAPGGPGMVRGPHIQIRHVQMPGGGSGQAVPLPPEVMQGLIGTLMAQAQQQAQQAQQQAQGGNQQSASSSSTSTTSSATTTSSASSSATSSAGQTTTTQAQTTAAQSTTTSSSTSTSSSQSRSANPSTSASATQPTFHASNTTGHNPQILLNPLLQSQSNAWDPYLNCQSRHAAAARLFGGNGMPGMFGRPQQGQAGQSRATGNGGNRATQQAQNEGPQGENAFADMIGGLVGALMNQPGQFMPQAQPASGTGPSGSTGSSSSSFTFGPFTGTRSTFTGDPSQMSEEVMANIMGQMSRQFGVANPGGQAVNQSLSDFFRSLGYAPDPSEGMGFLNDLVNMICQNLSMPDLAAIFFGNTTPLQTMRPNMQRFVNERIMRGEAMTPENIEVAVDRLIEEMRPVITSLLETAQTVNNIDPLASNLAFLRELLINFITLFVGPRDRSQFGDQLLRLVRNGMHEWVCLMIHMFGGREGFHTYMEGLLEALLSLGDHQEMANLAVSVSLSNLDTIASTMQVTEDQILQYVVKKDATQQTDTGGSSSQKASGEASNNGKAEKRKAGESGERAMEVDSSTPEQRTPSQSTQRAAAVAKTTRAARSNSTNGGVSSGAAAIGGATAAEPVGTARVIPNWQATVREEWVPVINQDIIRQRRQAPQASLSDAYLSGMPSKRLKLTQERNVPVSNGMETYVPETLRRAIQNAGVQPVTSMDTVMQEAKEDSNLHQACEEQVKSAVKERLRRDPDYDPQRFPNAENYFQKKK